ncbi:FAD dependent oxidoreductase-like protein [Dothistroma septosporum NZE10]|uniref:FAD dependent oxidoreductase-like protein n=1 Tax=Dothistroma septosporum (strain NZE10 / CBS 128990) TaxID=675120 RepID=N1PHV8_DOTSN|nr:FAD dependent oxidoreductase-like protein [Dothistroma septosporum NZE10]
MTFRNVAIIGAGLSGLTLALFLERYGIQSTVYELRRPDVRSDGAVMLSPNALRTLDAIGIYSKIKGKGYHFRDLTFRNNQHKLLDAYEMGNADKFGYDALRVYRQVLLDETKAMVQAAGIEIVYEAKFSHVILEHDNGVTFAFTNGEQKTADLLIGADGIHSTVRKYMVPDVKPTFSKFMAVTCAIPTSAIKWPFEPYSMPVGIHGTTGAFVMAPQNPEGSEVLAGTQFRTRERSQAEWDALCTDKKGLLEILRAHYDLYNETVQSAMDAVPLQTLSIWPFYTVPKLTRWSSGKGRIVTLGDAAHAIPPAAGQGVNQAYEDVHAFSLVIAATNDKKSSWYAGLRWWQEYRQARVERVTDLTNEMNKRRLPGWNGEEGSIDSSWLFSVDIEGDVKNWIESRK